MCILQSNLQGLDSTYIEKKRKPHEQKEERECPKKLETGKEKEWNQLWKVDEVTYKICFSEGYNSERSQHSVYEDEINLDVLESLHSSDAERLEPLVSREASLLWMPFQQ